ncbi:MAG: type I restriction enzyme endonuclease domain-containing protein, partial [Myxococcota bacterium]
AEGIEILVKEVSLFSREFGEKLDKLARPEARASEMEHAIRHEITVKLDENPAFYQSLRERLEEIVAQRKQRRIDAAEQLQLFQQLVEELRGVGQAAEQLGLSETGYAIYGLLHSRDGDVGKERASREMAETIEATLGARTSLVDWWLKEDILRRMRRDIKTILRGNVDNDQLNRYAADIVELMKRRQGR